MTIYILLFIIALLACLVIILLARNVQALRLLRKQNLQIVADAEFRGYIVKAFDKKETKTISKDQVRAAFLFSGVQQK
jgi:hypothetical protein